VRGRKAQRHGNHSPRSPFPLPPSQRQGKNLPALRSLRLRG